MILINVSARGRAYPDIAAQASNFQVVVSGAFLNIGGTSASAPVSDFISLPISRLSPLDGRQHLCLAQRHPIVKWQTIARLH